MNYSLSILLFSILIYSCNSSTTNKSVEEGIIESNNIKLDTILTSTITPTNNNIDSVKTYKGSWFEIKYPSDFTVSPTQPIDSFKNYNFINTDEAYFLSDDGNVEFFVYSPQWGGNPINYLNLSDNEIIESEKTTIDEIDSNIVIKWVTINDKDKLYSCSYYSKRTTSTHLIFGIKYNNQSTYDYYKKAYKAFKKSLIQYAD